MYKRQVRNEAVQFCEHQEVKERYRASVRTESGPGYSSDPHAHLAVSYTHLDGTFIEQFDAGGMNPNSAIFFN